MTTSASVDRPRCVVAFTGHRPDKLGGFAESGNQIRDEVVLALLQQLTELRPQYAITGMALGVDQWAAIVCNELEIPFIAAIPFAGQERKWPQASRDKYYELLERARVKHIVSPGEYSATKMQIRNEWMVNHATDILAVWDGTPGGTANCVRYAYSAGKTIWRFNPRADHKDGFKWQKLST